MLAGKRTHCSLCLSTISNWLTAPLGLSIASAAERATTGSDLSRSGGTCLKGVKLGVGTDMSSEIRPKAGGTLNNTNRCLKDQGTITKGKESILRP